MTAGARPRGRLPQRVYWFRRGLVLVVALGLVFGIGHLLGGGSSAPGPSATTAADHPTPTAAPSTVAVAPRPAKSAKPKIVLAQPDGPCLPTEVTVAPISRTAQAGKPITLGLMLTTTRPACTFTVSPTTVVVKITSGADRIWSSQDCPRSIPTTDVVVRDNQGVRVPISWSGRRSDTGCSRATGWANIGYYHAAAAALGGTATDAQFKLILPKRPVVVRTEKPRPHAKSSASASAKPSASASPGKGGVSGKGSSCGGDNAAGSC